MEIERKFWVKKYDDFFSKDSWHIIQSYINMPEDYYEIRVRKYENRGLTYLYNEYKYYLDFKGPGDIEREEFGIKINEGEYELLSSHSKKTLTKNRYYLRDFDGVFFDVYEGDLKGLMVLEVEGDRDYVDNFKMFPNWMVDDVTYDQRFKNRNLIGQTWESIKNYEIK